MDRMNSNNHGIEPIPKRQVPVIEKNQDGHLGAICNYCGGYGFTNNLSGGSGGCPKCDGSGIQTTDVYKLERRVEKMEDTLEKILDILKSK